MIQQISVAAKSPEIFSPIVVVVLERHEIKITATYPIQFVRFKPVRIESDGTAKAKIILKNCCAVFITRRQLFERKEPVLLTVIQVINQNNQLVGRMNGFRIRKIVLALWFASTLTDGLLRTSHRFRMKPPNSLTLFFSGCFGKVTLLCRTLSEY